MLQTKNRINSPRSTRSVISGCALAVSLARRPSPLTVAIRSRFINETRPRPRTRRGATARLSSHDASWDLADRHVSALSPQPPARPPHPRHRPSESRGDYWLSCRTFVRHRVQTFALFRASAQTGTARRKRSVVKHLWRCSEKTELFTRSHIG